MLSWVVCSPALLFAVDGPACPPELTFIVAVEVLLAADDWLPGVEKGVLVLDFAILADLLGETYFPGLILGVYNLRCTLPPLFELRVLGVISGFLGAADAAGRCVRREMCSPILDA